MNKESIEEIKQLLNKCGIHFNDFDELNGFLIERDALLNDEMYNKVKEDIVSLKSIFSSSYMTSLQSTASKQQKWPLINLVRQILKGINYKLTPIRRSDGYTKDGIKKFKRLFKIEKVLPKKYKTIHITEESDNNIQES